MSIFPVFIILLGLLLLGLSAGFFLAISFGIRRQDRRGSYRSLRDEGEESALSRTGSYVVGLHFSNDDPEGTSRDRTPTPA